MQKSMMVFCCQIDIHHETIGSEFNGFWAVFHRFDWVKLLSVLQALKTLLQSPFAIPIEMKDRWPDTFWSCADPFLICIAIAC